MDGEQEFSRAHAPLDPATDYEVEPARAERPEEVLRRLNAEAAARYAAANSPSAPPSAPLRRGAYSPRDLLAATTLFAVVCGAMRSQLGIFVTGLTSLMALTIASHDEFRGSRVELLLWSTAAIYFAISVAMWIFGRWPS